MNTKADKVTEALMQRVWEVRLKQLQMDKPNLTKDMLSAEKDSFSQGFYSGREAKFNELKSIYDNDIDLFEEVFEVEEE